MKKRVAMRFVDLFPMPYFFSDNEINLDEHIPVTLHQNVVTPTKDFEK